MDNEGGHSEFPLVIGTCFFFCFGVSWHDAIRAHSLLMASDF